jgi:sec-independent protein translocase protein TatB
MLLDFGWSELLLIGVVALVLIGPKDLPKALRVAGFWIRKARSLSREFQSSIDQMIREAELDDIRQELKKASQIDLDHEFRRTIDPTGSLEDSLKPPQLPDFSSDRAPNQPAPTADGTPHTEPDAAQSDAARPDAARPHPAETVPPAVAEPRAATPTTGILGSVADDDVAYDVFPPKR